MRNNTLPDKTGRDTDRDTERNAGRISGREIAPDVYYMEVGRGITRANVYFIRSGNSWVLIDAGLVKCG